MKPNFRLREKPATVATVSPSAGCLSMQYIALYGIKYKVMESHVV